MFVHGTSSPLGDETSKSKYSSCAVAWGDDGDVYRSGESL